MSIAHTSYFDLTRHLTEAGVEPGMDLCIHSRMISFGLIEGGISTVYRAIRAVTGPKATLVVPAYTLKLGADDIYDWRKTRSDGMGTFSEWFRQHPEAKRNLNPMHSHAAIGPNAGLLERSDINLAFGPNSDFEMFRRNGFHLLLLGCTLSEGGAYLHQVEVDANVPYREWMYLPRQILEDDGVVRRISYRYFGRKTASPYYNDFTSVERFLSGRGLLPRARAPYGTSSVIVLDTLAEAALEVVAADPFALVKEK